jgi:uncharacterized RDD family membrane protein YckC
VDHGSSQLIGEAVVFIERISLTTPERVVVEHDIAAVGSRAVAQLLDVLVMAGILTTVFGVFVNGLALLPQWLFVPILIVAAAVGPFAYFILFEWLEGATPGKLALKIKVVTDQGTPIGLRESAVRNVLRVVDILPFFYVLGGTVAMCSTRSQRLGDVAAGPGAVRAEPRPRGRTQAQRGTGSFVEQVERAAPAPVAPPETAAVVRQFLQRRDQLGADTRVELAGMLAERLETSIDRPAGATDEQYIEAAGKSFARA